MQLFAARQDKDESRKIKTFLLLVAGIIGIFSVATPRTFQQGVWVGPDTAHADAPGSGGGDCIPDGISNKCDAGCSPE